MGNFYTNLTVRGPSQDTVAAALRGRSAYVSPSVGGCVVVFDEQCEDQDLDVLAALGTDLSSVLACPVLAVLNHDDDVLVYHLYSSGKLIDDYNSAPTYFDAEAEPSDPEGGDAGLLCDAFGASSRTAVEATLRRSSYTDDGYAFAIERHADLAQALNIPSFVAGGGFRYIAEGELPPGLERDALTRMQ